jgi:hypothetical protein
MNSYNYPNQTTIVRRRDRIEGMRLMPAVEIAEPTSAHLWVRALSGDLAARDELLARIMPYRSALLRA